MDELLTVILRIAQVALGVGFVIFIHELGHFLAAKAVGIRVERFSLGFPPRVFGFRHGETDYCLSLIPLGGYVKMVGESPDDPTADAEGSFQHKTVPQRMLVITAGVIMNVLFAIVGFWGAFSVGVEMTVPAVGAALPGTAAEGVLERGDVLVAIDGETPLDFVDVALAAAFAGEEGLELTVRRGGKTTTVRAVPRKELGQEIPRLGVAPIEEVAKVEAGSAAEKAGVQRGDRLIAIEDAAPPGPAEGGASEAGGASARAAESGSLAEILERIEKGPGRPQRLTIERAGERRVLDLTPASLPQKTFGIAVGGLPAVLKVTAGPAQDAGLLEGDLVKTINGEPVDLATIVERVKAIAKSDKPLITLAVVRGGAETSVAIKPRTDGAPGPVIGAVFGHVLVTEAIGTAAAAGVAVGDRIVDVAERGAGLSTDDLDRFAGALAASEKVAVKLRKPDGSTKTVELAATEVPGKLRGELGVTFALATFTARAEGLAAPIALGFKRTVIFVEQVLLTLRGMFTRKIDASTLGGPIMISRQAYEITQKGLGTLLYFLCVISVNLAVLNILPIPVLDGGHLVFLIAEGLKGSPVSLDIQIRAQQVGLVLLIGLMLFVTRNDILRLIQG